jgi:hypothetical protein
VFGLFKKRAKPNFLEVREVLFGDVPLSEWKPRDSAPDTEEPWSLFAVARAALDRRDKTAAVMALRKVAETPALETRQYLQAWYFLRELGVHPNPDRAKQVLGVVLEVHLRDGLDTLAAYQDSSARYINHGGRLVVWEAADSEIGALIVDLLREGQRVADMIGPWEGPRRPAPPRNHVRLNMLTESGLLFGEGPLAVLGDDPMGGPVIAAGTALMSALIARAEQTRV